MFTGQAVLGTPQSTGMEQSGASNGRDLEGFSICAARTVVWQIQVGIAPGEWCRGD